MNLSVITSGMVSSVGLTAGSSCAAIRCGMSNLVATRFGDPAGGWLSAALVPTVTGWGGGRLLDLLIPAMEEALGPVRDQTSAGIAVFIVVAGSSHADGQSLTPGLIAAVEQRLNRRFHPASQVVAQGVIGGFVALDLARQALTQHGAACALIAGVDSLVVPEVIQHGLAERRIRTIAHPDGILLGEAAAAVLCAAPGTIVTSGIQCAGWHCVPAASQEQAAQVQATVAAISGACAAAGITPDDLAGQYGNLRGREAVLALAWQRLLRQSKARFISHAVDDSLGDIGAAWLPALAAVVANAHQRRWIAGGAVVAHLATADGTIAAAVFRNAEVMNTATVVTEADD